MIEKIDALHYGLGSVHAESKFSLVLLARSDQYGIVVLREVE